MSEFFNNIYPPKKSKDMAEINGTTNSEEGILKSKKAPKANVPVADADLGTTCTTASAKWLASPQVTLMWMTAADFKTKADSFNTILNERQSMGSNRPGITSDLVTVNRKLDEGIGFLKNYLASDFGKTASAHYSKFGIEKKGSAYLLPKDRDRRKDALKLILPALTTMGFTNKPYGSAYFTPLITEFNTLSGSARSMDESVSGHVGNKNELKTEIKLVLTSLIKILQANYPKTWKSVLREWGFQKEKY